ncbi:MAG: YDG domain-containing protein [Eubacteriales bacterium]|nr:YDG domain-containing protein [Eubacteriales bacterium]
MKNKKVKTMGICLSVAVMTTAAGTLPVMAQSSTDSVQIKVQHSNSEMIELTAEKPTVETEKVYDGTTDAEILELGEVSGIKGGDDITVEAEAHFSDKNAGLGKVITVTYTVSGEDAAKYKAPQSVSFSGCQITPRDLHLTGAKAANRTYNGETAVSVESPGTVDKKDLISGDEIVLNFSNVTMTAADANAREKIPVTAEGYMISGADSRNYTLCVPDDVTVTISPAPYEKSVLEKIEWTQTDFKYNGSEQKPEILPDSLPAGVTVETYSYSDDCTDPGLDKTAEAVLSCSDPNFTLPQSSVSTTWSITPCEPDLKIDYEKETVTVTYPEEYKEIPDMQTGIAWEEDRQETKNGTSLSLPLSKWELPVSEKPDDKDPVQIKGFLKTKQEDFFFGEPFSIPSRPSFDASSALEQLAGSWTVSADSLVCDNWNCPGAELRLVFENGDFSPWQDTASFTNLEAGAHVTGVEVRLKAVKDQQFASSVQKQSVDLYALSEAELSVEGELKKTYDGAAASVSEEQYTYNGDSEVTFVWLDQNGNELSEAPSEAGSYSVILSAPESSHYTAVTTEPIPYTIEKAQAPEIVWPTAGSITYGQSLSDSTLTDGSIEYGTFEWAEDVTPDAGTASYEVIFTPSDTENYNWDQKQYSSDIPVETAKKAISVIVKNASKRYGEADPEFTASAEGLLDGDVLSFDLTRTEGENAGMYEITADFSENTNYEATVQNGTFTIEPRQLHSVNMTTSCTVGFDPETQKQTVTVDLSDGSTPLTQGTDYEVTYSEATESAPASIIITGLGNYSGTQDYSALITDRFGSLCSFKASVIFDEASGQNILTLNTESSHTETGEELLDEYGNPVYSQRNLSLSRAFLDSLSSQSIAQIAFQVEDTSLMIPTESLTQDSYLIRLAPMEYTDMTWREYVILDEYLELSGSYRVRITTPEDPAALPEASAAEASPEEGAEAGDTQTADPELDVTAQIPGLKVRIAKPESDKTAEAEGSELAQRKILLVLRGSMEFDAARVELPAQSALNYYETSLPGSGMICLVQDRPENEWQ